MNELNLGELRSRAEAEMRFEGRVPSWPMRKFLTTNLVSGPDGAWRWQINLPVITAALSELERNPLAPTDQYGGPVQWIAGGQSDYVRPEDEAAIRAHFPAAQIRFLPASGHNPHMEARAEFVAAVLGGTADAEAAPG
jgi:pimeloyl-ACP methyl ester carboxylesterase